MSLIKHYYFSILLMVSLLLGGLFGWWYPAESHVIKPMGDLLLNLILTVMVPLIFFSLSGAMVTLKLHHQTGRLVKKILLVFLGMGLVASLFSLYLLKWFPLDAFPIPNSQTPDIASHLILENMVAMLSVEKFSDLFSHQHVLALMIFAMLVGVASPKKVLDFLKTGEMLCMKVFSYVMYYAPIGFFAYFANMVADLGPKVLSQYAGLAGLYYGFVLLYFFGFYSLLAYWVDGMVVFWKNVWLPASTALATCSSLASIPANLEASKRMDVAPEVYETSIPLGTLLHKEGSIIGGMFKIAFLLAAFHMNFSGLMVCLLAIGVSLLVGTVMGAIPGGGMLGEMLILATYGFPSEALVSIVAISIIIDPLATMLNATGNTIASLVIDRRLKKTKRLKPD